METAKELMITGEKPIVSSGRQEKLLQKLNEFKINNLTAKEKKLADIREQRLAESFIVLSWKFFGASKEQLKQLDDEDLKEMGALICRKARWLTCLQIPLFSALIMLIIPNVVMWDNVKKCGRVMWCWQYVANWNKLKKAYGENYSPAKAVKDALARSQ